MWFRGYRNVKSMDPLQSKYGNSRQKNSIHSISPRIGILFVTCLFILYTIVHVIDGVLPQPLDKDDEKSHPNAFITERAEEDVKLLTDLGPRVVGSSENEIDAVNLLKERIETIQQEAHKSQKIELDFQVVSGSYYLDFKPYGAINAYANVQNIVVKLFSRNESAHSLLVNAHFDSVATSPGGSDDGINCAVMLEVLRKLSRSEEQLDHNIIFLFNGAEETPLQASHGFITQHKWAKEVRVVINLEAAGAGGKEILFQSGPGQPWLLNYYKNVPYPNGQAAGEELFQTGLIPSGTDFRIFRDFGKIIGLDLAFNRGGHRYHTKYDGFLNIPRGSYQHVGDNSLYLIKNLANAPELANPQENPKENVVFYDIFGLFMICYSETAGIIINILISLLSIGVAIKSFHDFGLKFSVCTVKYIALIALTIVLGWLAAALFAAMFALLIDGVGYSMSWYMSPWILFGLYVVPTFTVGCGFIGLFNQYYNRNNLSISVKTQIQAHVIRLIWTFILLIGTCCGLRGVYLILIPISFHTLGASILILFRLQHSVRIWQMIYVLSVIIPNMFVMKLVKEVIAFLVPICGRIGNDRNSELMMALLVVALAILATSYYMPLITLVQKPLQLYVCLVTIFAVFFILVLTPLGFPYSGNSESPAPQRFWIYHMLRTFRNETNHIYKNDSGFFLLNMDRNSPNSVKKHVQDLNRIKSLEEDCNISLFCGLPISTSRMVAIIRDSTWIPAGKPEIPEPLKLTVDSQSKLSVTVTRFNITAAGPNHIVLYVSPKPKVKLIQTSLTPDLPTNPIIWNERPIYIIRYSWAKKRASLIFSLDFQTPSDWNKSTFDIAIAGIHMHDKVNQKTRQYKTLIGEFPDWADVVSWLGEYGSWVY